MVSPTFKRILVMLIISTAPAGKILCSESTTNIHTLEQLNQFEEEKILEFMPLVSQIKATELIPLTDYLIQTLRLSLTKVAHQFYALDKREETHCFQDAFQPLLNQIQKLELQLQSPEALKILTTFEHQLFNLSGFNYLHHIKHLQLQNFYSELYKTYFKHLGAIEKILFEKEGKSSDSKYGGPLSKLWATIGCIYDTIDYPAFPISFEATLTNPTIPFSFNQYKLTHIKTNFFELTGIKRFEDQIKKVKKTLTPEELKLINQFMRISREVSARREFEDARFYEKLTNNNGISFIEKSPINWALYSVLLKTIGTRSSELKPEEKEALNKRLAFYQDLLSIRRVLIYSPAAKNLFHAHIDLEKLSTTNTLKIISIEPLTSKDNSAVRTVVQKKLAHKANPELMNELKSINLGLYLMVKDIAPWETDLELPVPLFPQPPDSKNLKNRWIMSFESIKPFIKKILFLNNIVVLNGEKGGAVTSETLKTPAQALKDFIHTALQFPVTISHQNLHITNNIFRSQSSFSVFCGFLASENPLHYPNALLSVPKNSIFRITSKDNNKPTEAFSQVTRFLFKQNPNAFTALPKERLTPQLCDFLGINYSSIPSNSLLFFCQGGFILGDPAFAVFSSCKSSPEPLSPLRIKEIVSLAQTNSHNLFEGTFAITEGSETTTLPLYHFNATTSPFYPLRSLIGTTQKKKMSSTLKKISRWESTEENLFKKFLDGGASLSEEVRASIVSKAAKDLKLSFLLPLLNESVKTSQKETPEIDAAITSTLTNVENELNPSNEAKKLCKSLNDQISEDLTCTPTMLADYLTLQKQLSNALKLHVGTLRKLGKDLFITIPVPSRFTILNTQGAPADLSGFYSSFFLELNKRPFLCTPSAINRLNHDLKVQYHLDSPYSPFWFFTTNRLFGRIAELRARCLNKKTLTAYSLQKEDGVIQELVSQSDLKKQLDSLEKQCITAWQNEQKIIHLLNQLTLSEPLLNELTTHILSNGASYLTTYQAFFKAQLKQTSKTETIVALNDILRFLNLRNLLACRSTAYTSNIKLIISNAEFLWEKKNTTLSKTFSWLDEHEKRSDQSLPFIEKLKRNFKHKPPIETNSINFAGIVNHLKNEYHSLFEAPVKQN
ncbi:TPA: hypothetical protein DDZ86_04395 [Candidatus Dependentiae bacterium]|nr:hypothetical protein [Candidatus Dependentiae bacterium]